MAVVNVEKLRKTGSYRRLDAEFYQSKYSIDFSKGNWEPIKKFLRLCQYGISQAMTEEPKGYPIFRMDDVKNCFLFDDKVKYIEIPEQTSDQFKLEINDILFNRVNAEEFVGRTGTFKLKGDYVFASYLIRLRVKPNSGILPDYLNIFLNTKFGKKQIRRFSRRAVNQANVNAEELKNFKICIIPLEIQKQISRLSDEAWSKIELSKSLYCRAKNHLLEKLELKHFEPKYQLSYTTNLSKAFGVHRISAEYFQPLYENLLHKIVSVYPHEKLKKIARIERGSLINLDFYNCFEGTPYIRGKDFSSDSLERDSLVFIDKSFHPKNQTRIHTGDIVFALVGSVGTSALITKEFSNSFISNNVGKISLLHKDAIIPEYLIVFLHSLIGKLQFEKEASPTAQPKISPSQVGNFVVPILPKETQQKIASLARQSYETRKKAQELLEEAKTRVEERIKYEIEK